MTAVWARTRAELRAKWRSIIVLALVVGLAGGAALTAFAGARRTNTAVSRFLAYSRSPDLNVETEQGPEVLSKIEHLPQVAASEEGAYLLIAETDGAGHLLRSPGQVGTQAVISNPTLMGRPLIIEGRLPNFDRADEVLINASAAQVTGLKVGSRVHLQGWKPEDADELLRGTQLPPDGPKADVRVTGIGRLPAELSTSQAAPGVIYEGNGFMLFTPAFFRAYGDKIAIAGSAIGGSVRLKHGQADLRAFQAAVARIDPHAIADPGTDDHLGAVKARHATSIGALALLLFGILAALVAVAMVSQALARQAFVDAAEYPALGAMGMTRGQLVGVAAIRTAVIAGAGAVLALVMAFLLSPRMPIGVARQAEVHPGYSFDAALLLLGAAAILIVITGAAALTSWRTARAAAFGTGPAPAAGAERPSLVADRLSRAGLPPSTVVGVRMALEPGRGSTAVPVRTTLVSAVAAVALLVGTLGFGASLTRLANRPRLQGWNWDVAVGNPHSDDISDTAIPTLQHNPDVAAFSSVAGPAGIGTRRFQTNLMAIGTVKGSVLPPFLNGRAPAAPDEIAFGAKDLRTLHKSVGQRVTLSAGGPPRSMRIVGRMVLTPTVVNDQVRMGEGALVTPDGFQVLGVDPGNAPTNVFLLRLHPGVNRAAALRRLRAEFPGTVLTALRPSDVENLRRVDSLPSILAALFAAIALFTVGHMLVSSVRRRRHDVAILRTMGFVRRQVAATVAWQATTVVLVGLLVGLPIGIAGGRWAWLLVANQLGVQPQPVTPPLVIIAVVAGSLLLANALASLPGAVAARTRPAEILRTE